MQGVPAQTVAASMTPIFETTTAATTHTAIPAAMNLEPGMRYCWRVTVFDPSGKALINKNGQSEVREFTYLHTCPTVDEVTATVHNARVDFSWTPSPYHTHFQVELVGDNGVSELNDCYDSQFKLYDFPRGSTWKVRVRGECSGGLEADWSPWSDFEIDPPGTPPTPEECPNCGCDDAPKPRAITNYELKELHEGDTIENRTGRTRFIVLTAVPNGDGSYNGQFYIWLELWKTKVRCDYTDLKVNTDGVIFDGQWRSVRNDGLMVNPAAVAAAVTDIRNNTATVFYDNSIRDTLKLSYAVQTIYKDQNDNYIAVLSDGTEKDVTPLLANAGRTMVEDAEGNKMVVTSDHRLMSAEQYHKTGKNSTLISNDNNVKDRQIATGEVVFSPSSLQTYGFDAYNETNNNYPEIYPALEGGYRPAYKSIAQWQTDKVLAEPINGVTFRNQMGAPYATTNGEILLRGEPQPGETPVYAHVAETDSTTKVVGKLNLLTFEPREINVCLVPVNGASLPNAQTLEKELNKIFKPAVASVKLSTHSGVKINYADNKGFVHGGSGLLSVYSNDEKNAIKALQNADNDTYYLFVVDNVTRLNADGTAMKDILAGYMPIGYQCGFLFGSPAAKYVAHELGHGAFGLHHTFSSETESFSAPQYSTDNLMDYAEGATLNHKQWTWMHEKHGKGLFGFLADEDEGAYKYSIYDDYIQNKKVEIGYWKWQKNGAPNLTMEKIDEEYFSIPMNEYQKELFHGIATDIANLKSRDKESAEMFKLLVEEGNIDEEILTILIKERHELAEYCRTVVPLIATANILMKYCVVLSAFSSPNALPSMGKIGTYMAKLTGAKAANLASKISSTFAELHPGEWLKHAGKLFMQGTIIDASIQTVVNTVVEEDLKAAIGEIDFADVAFTGAVNVVTGGSASLRKLFGTGTRIAVIKGTTVVTLELTSASIDWKPFNGSEQYVSIFSGDKDAQKFFCDFVLSISGNVLPDEMLNIFKKWSKADFDVRWYSTLTTSEKNKVRKIYDIVHSSAFENALETNATFVKTFIQKVINQNEVVIKTIDVKSFESIPEEYIMPADNTNVVTPRIYGY